MGSPPFRLAFVALVALLVGAAASPARADEAGAAQTATSFLGALAKRDGAAVCRQLTPQALAVAGGAQTCEKTYGREELPDVADYKVISQLHDALRAAEKSAIKRRGAFVTKRFGVRALARDMERIDEELTVKVASGPRAAAGQLPTTVILDRRTSQRRVVLYAESDDGSIFRLSAAMLGDPDFDEVGQGVPERDPAPPPALEDAFTFQIGGVTLLPNGTAYVNATLTFKEGEKVYTYGALLELVPAADGYLVADAFYSLINVTESLG